MSIVIYFFTFKLMIEKQLKITITNKMNKYNSTSSIWPTMHSLARDLIRLVPFYQSSSSIASTDITKMYSTNLYSFFHHAMREWKYAFLYSKVRRAITNVSTKCSVNPLHVFFCLSSRSEFNGCVIDWGFVYSFLSKQFLILLKAAISEESVISSHRHWIESTTPDFSCRPWLCLMTGLCQLICLLFVMLLAWRLAKCWSDVIDINSQHIFRSLTKFARKHRIVELSRM